MRQKTIFDKPASHTDDPVTSHEAERRHTVSGRRGAAGLAVLKLVRAFAGDRE